ncbi:uncharacterized protein VTP21DRAFT_10557 [Calcarisporiella thermophila]|uniref:uncharacterized protein n=1 Tax=Calcarisporiella thermophila TaxID=911321 RepID=UPI0037430548
MRYLSPKNPLYNEEEAIAFEYTHCGHSKSEIQPSNAFAEKGIAFTCHIETKEDLRRKVVTTKFANIKIFEDDIELISHIQIFGILTTVEGLVNKIIENLSRDESLRKRSENVPYQKPDSIVARLRRYLNNAEPFTLVIEDPSGYSYIKNLGKPIGDQKLKVDYYIRTQDEHLSLRSSNNEHYQQSEFTPEIQVEEIPQEVMAFAANCPACKAPSETRMHVIGIPYFKEIVIMSTRCDACGYKSNDMKSGGAISLRGKKITLKIVRIEDMSRDLIKSETCGLQVPEIQLELAQGTLGGRYTTVEGLLLQLHDTLEKLSFLNVESAMSINNKQQLMEEFLEKLRNIKFGEMLPITLILDDPLANSYIQNSFAPEEDSNMKIGYYDRSWEQNEELGLNDLKPCN